MAIKNIKERLEGSYRLIRIRRIKRIFFVIQLIIATVLGLIIAFLSGAKFDPLYFPADSFIFIFLIFIMIMSVETIYFRGMEIKYTRNKSRRFLIARNSMRRSGMIIAVCALLVFILFLPQTQEYVLDTYSADESGINIPVMGSNSSYFSSQDRFGLVRASSIDITLDEPCEVGIYKNSDNRILPPQNVDTVLHWSGLGDYSNPVGEITVFINSEQPVPVTCSYEVSGEVTPFITTYFPAMGLAFIIIQFAAITIMYPIKERYASSSIYSKKYVAKTEAGEYRISSRVITKKDEAEQVLLDRTLYLEAPPLPPPPPVSKPKVKTAAPPPPPPEEVEMARTKGKVDDELIEEEDVICAKCGEPNSAHSAICFSCGEELLVAETKTIDLEEYLKKGMRFANAGKHDDAMTCYDEVLKHEMSHEKTLVQKGQLLHKLGKWGSAVQYVNTALKLNPRNIEALLLKADILDSRDRQDKSIEVYSQIHPTDPNNAIAKSKLEQVSEEVVLENVEDVLELFMCIPGVGLARATTLYDAGYTSMGSLKTASEEQLAAIKGISKGLAKKIKKDLDSQ